MGEELGVNEVARFLSLSPSVVHRLMITLREHDFLEQDDRSRKFRIGPKALEVGLRFHKRNSFASLALQAMQQALPEYTCFVGVLVEDEVLMLAAAEGTGPIKIGVRAGERRHAHCTAVGKALLALRPDDEVLRILSRSGMPRITPASITEPSRLLEDLKAIRERGYAVNDEESLPGVVSIGVAVDDTFGRPVGAISVSAPKFMVTPDRIHEVGSTLMGIASALRGQVVESSHPSPKGTSR